MLGKVDNVWRNEREDGSQYWVVSIDGKRYSTWDAKLAGDVQPGDPVEFAFVNSGRFRNLTALKRAPPSGVPTPEEPQVAPERMRVMRMNCLRTAAELLRDTTALPEQKTSMAIALAERLQTYVQSGQAPHESQPTASGPSTDAAGADPVNADG
jgi:hypothetical protein